MVGESSCFLDVLAEKCSFGSQPKGDENVFESLFNNHVLPTTKNKRVQQIVYNNFPPPKPTFSSQLSFKIRVRHSGVKTNVNSHVSML